MSRRHRDPTTTSDHSPEPATWVGTPSGRPVSRCRHMKRETEVWNKRVSSPRRAPTVRMGELRTSLEERKEACGRWGPRRANPGIFLDRSPMSRVDPETEREEGCSSPKERGTPDRDDPSTCGGWSEGRSEVSIVGGPIVELGLSRTQGECKGNPRSHGGSVTCANKGKSKDISEIGIYTGTGNLT